LSGDCQAGVRQGSGGGQGGAVSWMGSVLQKMG